MRKSRPLLYSAPMAQATIKRIKIQTRREVQADLDGYLADGVGRSGDEYIGHLFMNYDTGHQAKIKCPYGEVGDLLWVREEHYRFGHWREVPGVLTKGGKQKWAFIPDTAEVLYDAPDSYRKSRSRKDPENPAWHKRLARFMPRSASRTLLEVTSVRVERLHDISEEDAKAEGAVFHDGRGIGHSGWRHDLKDVHDTARNSFFRLWRDINGEESLMKNPWVWVIGFKVVEVKGEERRAA